MTRQRCKHTYVERISDRMTLPARIVQCQDVRGAAGSTRITELHACLWKAPATAGLVVVMPGTCRRRVSRNLDSLPFCSAGTAAALHWQIAQQDEGELDWCVAGIAAAQLCDRVRAARGALGVRSRLRSVCGAVGDAGCW
jgi:hypothetical protein